MAGVDVAFGECELSTDRMELRRAGELVAIEPQVFEVLAYLVARRERMVPKHELLDEVWGDRFVSESALTSRIKTARQAIGDTGRDQRIIKTIHGRGYRFVAEVAALTAKPETHAPPATTLPRRATGVTAIAATVTAGQGVAVELTGSAAAVAEALEEVVDEALSAGLLVGRATCGRGGPPLRCLVDALDEVVQRAPTLLEDIPPACRTELDAVFAGAPPSTRQRLFVAVRELVVAAARQGAVIVLEDPPTDPDTTALVATVARLVGRHRLGVVVATSASRRLPGFERVEVAGSSSSGHDAGIDGVPTEVCAVIVRAGLVGGRLDRLDVLAAAGGDEALAEYARREAVRLGAWVAGPADTLHVGDGPVLDELGARAPEARSPLARAELAQQLDAGGADPERVATQWLAAGQRDAAVPYALAAARAAADAQHHSQVLHWVDAVRDVVTGAAAVELLTLRADALAATGAPTAVAAYRAAIATAPADVAMALRVRLARAAMLSGDLASAEEALDGLEPPPGPNGAPLVLARGMLAYFHGDLDAADAAAQALRAMVFSPGAPVQLLDVITLQGMVAHDRGEWFDRLRRELHATSENPAVATTVFDSHLCVAEYLLYGPTSYDEVRRLAAELLAQAERAGARRAMAFAVALAGEAALLAGDLDEARRELERALELHRAIGADTGTAHAMQRLAEVELACGERSKAERLVRRALPLARWSPFSRHLLQRIYGTLIAAAPDPATAAAVVDEAAEALDEPSACAFCQVMVAVPSAIACAEAGRLDDARHHLEVAVRSATLWHGTSWQAAIAEAKAHLARAEGDGARSDELLAEAAAMFAAAGQPLDAERCREASTATPARA